MRCTGSKHPRLQTVLKLPVSKPTPTGDSLRGPYYSRSRGAAPQRLASGTGEEAMIEIRELLQLIADGETDRVERTVATNKTDKFCEAICAFANDMAGSQRPGYLIVGTHDDGSTAGITVDDDLLLFLGGLRTDGHILPVPAMQVYKVALPDGDMAVVEVQPSDLPPVRYKGRTYIRVGPRRAIANEQEERILSERRSALVRTFDIQPVPEATLDDLVLRLFHEYRAGALAADVIEANHRSTKEALAALRFFDLRRDVPTVAGVLLFGVRPRFFLPGAYVQFLKFPGQTMDEPPIDQLEASGDLTRVIGALHDKIRNFNLVGIKPGAAFRDQTLPAYPEWALRELLNNAVIHRDYASTSPIRFYWFSDRIEIQNPGGLYGHLTPDDLRISNAYRNPVLAAACKTLGYVNKFGHGLQRADRLLAENGNPPLMLTIRPGTFACTVWQAADR